ncbi:major facilitator superfamily domain-containing protein [Aspergillus desertorum]
MAFVPPLQHELTSPVLKLEPATRNQFVASNGTSLRQSADLTREGTIANHLQDAPALPAHAEPEQAQQSIPPVAVTTLIVISNLVQMIVNFAGIAGGRTFIESMGVKQTYATWIAASYGLTQGTFVLMSGRLGDVYGHRKMLLSGGAWLVLCSFVGAFVHRNFFAFVTMRALAGVGGACIMPNAVAMIAITNPPGRVRNHSLGFFAASAPLGGYFSALFLGALMEHTHWRRFFTFVACLGAVIFIPLWLLSSNQATLSRNEKIDWLGAALGTSSLILFNFVWNQAPSVGGASPYEIALLVLSVILFTIFIVWEHKTSHPIMPPSIFRAPSFAILVLVILLGYMTVGTVLWYQLLWLQDVWGWSTLQFAVGWTPFVICGTFAACLAAWLIPRLAAQWILALGTVTVMVSTVLIATIPLKQSYWAQMFPSVVLFTFCPDFVAGFASTVEVQVAKTSWHSITGYRAALYFGVAISAVALLLDVAFVRRVKDEREGWEEGDQDGDAIELAQAATTGAQVSRLEAGQGSSVVQRVE